MLWFFPIIKKASKLLSKKSNPIENLSGLNKTCYNYATSLLTQISPNNMRFQNF